MGPRAGLDTVAKEKFTIYIYRERERERERERWGERDIERCLANYRQGNRTGWCSDKALDSYSGGMEFESP